MIYLVLYIYKEKEETIMNAQKLANDWNIDNETMVDYLLAVSGDDLGALYFTGSSADTIDEDNIDMVELDAEQVSKILKFYFEDESID